MQNEKEDPMEQDEWMIRPCHVYKEDYKDCKSIKARFNQYFIYGESLDCSKHQDSYDNCLKWAEDQDREAAVIENERIRMRERLQAHYRNTVWEKRAEPPTDWNKPLPDWLQKRNENSYLDIKARSLNTNNELMKQSLCLLM